MGTSWTSNDPSAIQVALIKSPLVVALTVYTDFFFLQDAHASKSRGGSGFHDI